MNRWISIIAVIAVGLLVGACSPENESHTLPRRQSSPSQSPEWTIEAEKKEWPVEHASSEPAEMRVPTRFRLYTHCGVDWMVDFDGSFWKAIGEAESIDNEEYRGLRDPSEWGTMTLVTEDGALYESRSGVTIDFSRGRSAKRISPCY